MPEHFHRSEFTCPKSGYSFVRPLLLERLEVARAIHQRPMRIVSGYRSPEHNHEVGGAQDSQHVYGAAADLELGALTVAHAIKCGFTGIGSRGDWATHVDVRDGRLTQWSYLTHYPNPPG